MLADTRSLRLQNDGQLLYTRTNQHPHAGRYYQSPPLPGVRATQSITAKVCSGLLFISQEDRQLLHHQLLSKSQKRVFGTSLQCSGMQHLRKLRQPAYGSGCANPAKAVSTSIRPKRCRVNPFIDCKIGHPGDGSGYFFQRKPAH